METVGETRKKRSCSVIFLYCTLGIMSLVVISYALAYFLPDSLEISRQKIGVVEVKGILSDSRDIVRQISKYRKDPSIHGIILRIDSPGGPVAPAQEIYNEVLKTRAQKNIIASMGSLAASGGYYIASPATRIVANPGTLTGSIGVIMVSSNIQKLMRKIGLEPVVVKSGKYKDIGSPMRPMSEEERQILRNVVDDVHAQFVEAISKGRNLPIEEVRKLADGRIFTGRQALDLKLVDQLGGFEDSIELLMELEGMTERPRIVQESESRSVIDWLLQGLLRNSLGPSALPSPFPTLQYLWYAG